MNKSIAKDNASPLFSVILPTYNRADMFSRAVSSVLLQSFRNFELIIIDDCSTNNYTNIICKALHVPYKLIKNPFSLGAGRARNAGIEVASGKYISFLDDDDEYLPSFLQSAYNCLHDTAPEIGLSWCSVNYFDYSKNDSNFIESRTRKFKTKYSSNAELFEQLMSIGIGSGVTIKKDCLARIGLFCREFEVVEDTDLFLRLLSVGFAPTVVPGTHINVHNHTHLRLTNLEMHHKRISECELLAVRHQHFLHQFPSLYKQLKHQISFLKNEILAQQTYISII